MQLTFFGKSYPIKLVRGPLFKDSVKCKAKFQDNPRALLISDDCPVDERYRELCHEAAHAWRDIAGKPADEEAEAQDTAAFCDTIDEQLSSQGGRGALMAIQIDDRAESPTGTAVGLVLDRIACPCCGSTIMRGSIGGGELVIDEEMKTPVMPRWCQCPVCDVVISWREVCTPQGRPLGQYPDQPQILRGKEAREFVVTHPLPFTATMAWT